MTHRCFLCDAQMWAPTDRGLVFRSGRRRTYAFACGSCGVVCDDPERAEECRADLERRLAGEVFEGEETAPYGLDIYTLRTAATAFRRIVEPLDGEQARVLREPHGAIAGAGRLRPLEEHAGPAVSLGVLCRPGELDAVLATLVPHRRWTGDIVVVVDAADGPDRAVEDVRIVSRPLGDSFAEQRNALQALSSNPWMLQLDADEGLDAAMGAFLPALAGMADRDGAVSIGLPRSNLVDGVRSDVFPDVQYRLNRRELRYAGHVHEGPERPWQQSFIALCEAIEHRLTRAHVLARSRRYEAMAPGRGRLEERDALLTPYRA